MRPLTCYALPFSFVSRNGAGPKEVLSASSILLWVDHPFVITAAQPVLEYQRRLAGDSTGRVWLGQLQVDDITERLVCLSERHNLATLRVSPDELDALGPRAVFFNPLRWPPAQVHPGEEVRVLGYPRDQWPASLTYTFRVESVASRRFEAVLSSVDMPGHMEGLCGAPVFRTGSNPEFVGIVVESMFHNEVIRAQHAMYVDQCGQMDSGECDC
jgi:hypothetical protein